jgi:hypothetical protein
LSANLYFFLFGYPLSTSLTKSWQESHPRTLVILSDAKNPAPRHPTTIHHPSQSRPISPTAFDSILAICFTEQREESV